MKTVALLGFLLVPALLHAAPPPVYRNETQVRTETTDGSYVYDQKPLPGYQVFVTRDQADAVVNKFKEAYPKLGNPRVLIYVNRDLVDTQSGMRLTARNEKVDTTRTKIDSTVEPTQRNSTGNVSINAGGNVSVGGETGWEYTGKGKVSKKTDNIRTENRYSSTDRKNTLADKQTVRDVERLFGRPLRAAGVTLADQTVATQLIANRTIKEIMGNTEGEQARKDREALRDIADIAIEILISSRNITIADVSGDKTYTAPDLQATAIRLNDSRILGQASSRDVTGKDRYSGRIVRNYDVQEIAEATALALMEDIAMSAK
jgi:hypothetical protein